MLKEKLWREAENELSTNLIYSFSEPNSITRDYSPSLEIVQKNIPLFTGNMGVYAFLAPKVNL